MIEEVDNIERWLFDHEAEEGVRRVMNNMEDDDHTVFSTLNIGVNGGHEQILEEFIRWDSIVIIDAEDVAEHKSSIVLVICLQVLLIQIPHEGIDDCLIVDALYGILIDRQLCHCFQDLQIQIIGVFLYFATDLAQ